MNQQSLEMYADNLLADFKKRAESINHPGDISGVLDNIYSSIISMPFEGDKSDQMKIAQYAKDSLKQYYESKPPLFESFD